MPCSAVSSRRVFQGTRHSTNLWGSSKRTSSPNRSSLQNASTFTAAVRNRTSLSSPILRIYVDSWLAASSLFLTKPYVTASSAGSAVQKRLLSEDKLTISKALDIIQTMESADRNVKELKRSPAAVLGVSQPVKPKSCKPCYHCGCTNHDDQDCRFHDGNCHNCGKTGHIPTVCRSKKTSTSSSERRKLFAKTSRAAKWVAEDDAQRSDSARKLLFS